MNINVFHGVNDGLKQKVIHTYPLPARKLQGTHSPKFWPQNVFRLQTASHPCHRSLTSDTQFNRIPAALLAPGPWPLERPHHDYSATEPMPPSALLVQRLTLQSLSLCGGHQGGSLSEPVTPWWAEAAGPPAEVFVWQVGFHSPRQE